MYISAFDSLHFLTVARVLFFLRYEHKAMACKHFDVYGLRYRPFRMRW